MSIHGTNEIEQACKSANLPRLPVHAFIRQIENIDIFYKSLPIPVIPEAVKDTRDACIIDKLELRCLFRDWNVIVDQLDALSQLGLKYV